MNRTIKCEFNDQQVEYTTDEKYPNLGFLPCGVCVGCSVKNTNNHSIHVISVIGTDLILCVELDSENPTKHLALLEHDNNTLRRGAEEYDALANKLTQPEETIAQRLRRHMNPKPNARPPDLS